MLIQENGIDKSEINRARNCNLPSTSHCSPKTRVWALRSQSCCDCTIPYNGFNGDRTELSSRGTARLNDIDADAHTWMADFLARLRSSRSATRRVACLELEASSHRYCRLNPTRDASTGWLLRPEFHQSC